MQKTSVLITTHDRNLDLRRCVKSVARYMPGVPIIVVSDSPFSYSLVKSLHKIDAVETRVIEIDAGLSAMRNAGLNMAKTPYVLICEDDFELTENSKIEHLASVLDSDPNVACAAGSLYYEGQLKHFACRLNLDYESRGFEAIPITKFEWKETPSGVRYHFADYVFNFMLFRRDARIRWDEDYKIAIEHIDFFIRLKSETEFTAAHVPEVSAVHHHSRPSAKYNSDRARLKYWEAFYKKSGWRHGVFKHEKRVYDLKNAKQMPYPEYVYTLMRSNKRPL